MRWQQIPALNIGLLLLVCSLPATSTAGPHPQAPPPPGDVTYCDLAANPRPFDKARVRVTASVTFAFENFTIGDPSCAPPAISGFQVWVAFGGDVLSGAIYCCPGEGTGAPSRKPARDPRFPLVADATFQRFKQILDTEKDSVIHGTFVGTLLVRPEGNFSGGYGHMGCCSLFVIERVERFDDRDGRDVDFSASLGSGEGRRCWGGQDDRDFYLTPEDFLRQRRDADAGARPWVFDQPERVALDAARARHGSAVDRLVPVTIAQGRRTFEWRHGRSWTTIVVSKPASLSSMATATGVPWVVTKIETHRCSDKAHVDPAGNIRAQVTAAFVDAFGSQVVHPRLPKNAMVFELTDLYAVEAILDDHGWPAFVTVSSKRRFGVPASAWPSGLPGLTAPIGKYMLDPVLLFLDVVRPIGAAGGAPVRSGAMWTQLYEHARLVSEDGSGDKYGSRGAVRSFTVTWISGVSSSDRDTFAEHVTVAAALESRPRAIGVSSQAELGSIELAQIRGVAADDPIRAMQALPGVATGDDYRADFSVRGSAFRHVGIVLDGTPTQLLMHTVRNVNDSGSIGMINSDILGRAALLAGPQARTHGDWLGATLEFDVREGLRDRTAGRLAVSGTAASALVEGPLGRSRRGSFLFSMRKSYIDWLVRQLKPQVDNTMGFRDAHLKLTFDVTPRQQVQLFGVIGDAAFHQPQTGLANGIHVARSYSGLASARWRFVMPRAVFSQQFSILRNTYGTTGMIGQHLAYGVMDAMAWRSDMTMSLRRGWTVDGGTRIDWSDGSETQRNYQASGQLAVKLRREQATIADPTTLGAWGQMSWRGAKSGVAVGVRAADRTQGVRGIAAPWLLVERSVGKAQLTAGLGRSFQFVDPILASLVPGGFNPERAWAMDVGVEHPLGRELRLQVTACSRRDTNMLGRTDDVRLDPVTGNIVAPGFFATFSSGLAGIAKGIDVLVSRRSASGPSGWIGYTWSHTRYHDGGSGEVFDGDFDQRHTLNAFVQQRLPGRLSASGKLRIGSNFPIAGYFAGTPLELSLGSLRNQVRLPFYSRLDLRVDRSFKFDRSRLTVFVEVMNLLDHDNGRQSDGSINPITLRATGFLERLLPRVPSAGLLFEF